jgi:outer membrane immunogenic protein
MKKTIAAAAVLLASTVMASAADMAVKSRPMAAPIQVWSWTGIYGGLHVGAGWGETESSLTGGVFTPPGGPAIPFTFALPLSQTASSGFLGGVQAGANYQAGWAVFGIQGDFSGADIKGTSPCLLLLACKTSTNWLASVTGRVGAVVADRGLIYAKGGAAWENNRYSVSLPLAPGLGDITNREITRFGWTVGLGTEWMITNNWTAFIEYNYYEFDRKNYGFPILPAVLAPATLTLNADVRNTLSVAKVGVNYKFDWGSSPVVARY